MPNTNIDLMERESGTCGGVGGGSEAVDFGEGALRAGLAWTLFAGLGGKGLTLLYLARISATSFEASACKAMKLSSSLLPAL